MACSRGLLASESFVNVKAASASDDSITDDDLKPTAFVRVYDGEELGVVPRSASALRALLLQGRGDAARSRGGALQSSLRVLG